MDEWKIGVNLIHIRCWYIPTTRIFVIIWPADTQNCFLNFLNSVSSFSLTNSLLLFIFIFSPPSGIKTDDILVKGMPLQYPVGQHRLNLERFLHRWCQAGAISVTFIIDMTLLCSAAVDFKFNTWPLQFIPLMSTERAGKHWEMWEEKSQVRKTG